MKVSLIITTYNWPDALRLSLMSVVAQTRVPDEVIIADDGSGEETRQLICEMAKDFPCTLKHAWQEDLGFRAAESRNNALRQCEGDYVIMIDGDIVMHPHFVEDHMAMARTGYYTIGSRTKLKNALTQRLLQQHSIDVSWHTLGVHRRQNAFYLPLLGKLFCNYRNGQRLYGRSCNMAAFMSDLVRVNGFNAALEGYGFEDTDLIARLNNLGLKKQFAKFRAITFHLYHPEKSFNPDNEGIFKRNMHLIACEDGIVKRAV